MQLRLKFKSIGPEEARGGWIVDLREGEGERKTECGEMNKRGGGEGNDWLNGLRRMPPVPDFLRMFPVVKSKRLGKLGPGFGIGAGCGIGIGIGFMGGIYNIFLSIHMKMTLYHSLFRTQSIYNGSQYAYSIRGKISIPKVSGFTDNNGFL